MKSCIRYQEMISQYIDGELSPEDEKELTEHLSHCDGCRSLLEIYRSCRDAYSGRDEEPPQELLKGVMSRISGTKTTPAANKRTTESRRTVRGAIITFAALAACAAIVIFSFPGIFQSGSKTADTSGNDTAMPPSVAESSAADEAPSENAVEDSGGTYEDSDAAQKNSGEAEDSADDSEITPADEEYFAVVTIDGELPDILNPDDFRDHGDGTLTMMADADTVSELEALGYSAVYSENGGENALIIWIPQA